MPSLYTPTLEQVSQVAEQIKQQGGRPNVREIKNRLGGNPSANTILKHLATWREDNLPNPMPYFDSKEWEEATRRTVEKIWNEAVTAAKKEVAKEMHALKQENERLRSRIIDLELNKAQ
ncbi:MAG: hypothetical protein AWU57_202 [Marinobacter sp. T13-3]|nr:MAG: hypothetical protein AWU57_202 [Marinobacter sp. T13-3]